MNTDSKNKQIKFLMNESEYEDFKAFVETKTHYTMSNFIREAMNYYKRYLENPIIQNNIQITPELTEAIKRLNEKFDNYQEIIKNQADIIEAFKKEKEIDNSKKIIRKKLN